MPFVTCPDCDAESTAPRELIGLEWTCPKCGVSFVVEDDVPRAPLRRRKRDSAGPWVAMGALLIASLFVFGILAYAVSRASHPPEKPIAANSKERQLAKDDMPVRGERRLTSPSQDERADDEVDSLSSTPVMVAVGLFALCVYFAPTLIALARGHINISPILVVNFLLGWLLVGWVIALAWAFTDLKHLEHRRRSYL